MAKVSHYKILTILLASFNLTQAFNIFWKFRINSSECFKEEELIKQVQENPNFCYQGTHNSSSVMTTEDCVRNIECTENEKIDFARVPVCKTDTEIICCLHTYQCKYDYKARKLYHEQSDCSYVVNLGGTHLSHYRLAGQCAFPFIYKNKTYNKCTVFADNACLRWCAKLVNSNNEYIKNSGLWAYCDRGCPVNYQETCHDKKKIPMFVKESKLISQAVQMTKNTCGTQNTTTFIESKGGGPGEEFTLYNPGNCSFPFNYRGVWYSTCITKDDPLCRFWCSVRNDHGYHRKLGSKWAYCNNDCPKQPQYTNKCKKGKLENHFYQDEFSTLVYHENEDPNFVFDYAAYDSYEED